MVVGRAPRTTLHDHVTSLRRRLGLTSRNASQLTRHYLRLRGRLRAFCTTRPRGRERASSPTLIRPLLCCSTKFNFSRGSAIGTPSCRCSRLGNVIATAFRLPRATFGLHLSPNRLPYYVASFIFSSSHVLYHPIDNIPLRNSNVLFLGSSPGFVLRNLGHFPTKVGLNIDCYCFPLRPLTSSPLFTTILRNMRCFRGAHIYRRVRLSRLRGAATSRGRAVRTLRGGLSRLRRTGTRLDTQDGTCRDSLRGVLSSDD